MRADHRYVGRLPALGILLFAVALTSCTVGGQRLAQTRRAPPTVLATTSQNPSTHTATTVPPTPPASRPLPTPAPSPDRLTTVTFLNPINGYGLYSRQGQTCATVFGRTDDAGALFDHLTTVESHACGTSPPVSQIAFDDQGDGFVYGPRLYVSHDDGSTWVPSAQLGDVLSVEALGQSIWMVGTDCPTPGFQPACRLRLVESGDGGRTWSSASVPNGATTDNVYGAGSGQTWLVRLDPIAAYLATNVPIGRGQPQPAPLWFTGDGGRTWASRPIDCGIRAMTVALSAATDGALVGVCSGEPGAGSQIRSTVRSTDGGVTWWTMTPCPPAVADTFDCFAKQPLSAGYLGEIDALSSNTVFLAGGRSALMVTHDGGVTWTAVRPFVGDTSVGSWSLTFFNQMDGEVLANNPGAPDNVVTLWSTTDGGRDWQPVTPLESSASAFAECANDQLAISAVRFGQAGGSASEVLAFKDVGVAPCSLSGYPGVAVLNTAGEPAQQAIRRINAMLGGQFEGVRPATVDLAPGQDATATVEGSDNPVDAEDTCPYYPAFEVTAPDQTRSVTLRGVGAQGPGFTETGFPGCTPVIVTPIVPGDTGSSL